MSSNWILHNVDSIPGVVMTQRNVIWVEKDKEIYFKLLDNRVLNAMYDDEEEEAEEMETVHWRFNCKTIAMVGLTTKREFAKSHRLRAFALYWVGRLGDGSYTPKPIVGQDSATLSYQGSLTTSEYGLEWPESTEIHLIAYRTATSFQLACTQDKRSLGLAYDLDMPVNERLYPVVRFFGPGQAAVFKLDRLPTAPTGLQRDPEIFEDKEGFWSIVAYGPDPTPTAKPYPVRLFRLNDDQFDFQLKVVNTISLVLSQTQYGCKIEKIRKGSYPGDPELARDEDFLLEYISSLNNIRLGDDEESLIIETQRGDVFLKRFIRSAPEPYRSCPLRKLHTPRSTSIGSVQNSCCKTF